MTAAGLQLLSKMVCPIVFIVSQISGLFRVISREEKKKREERCNAEERREVLKLIGCDEKNWTNGRTYQQKQIVHNTQLPNQQVPSSSRLLPE